MTVNVNQLKTDVLKVLAELDYYMMYHQEDDTVEAFNIKPDGDTKDKEAA